MYDNAMSAVPLLMPSHANRFIAAAKLTSLPSAAGLRPYRRPAWAFRRNLRVFSRQTNILNDRRSNAQIANVVKPTIIQFKIVDKRCFGSLVHSNYLDSLIVMSPQMITGPKIRCFSKAMFYCHKPVARSRLYCFAICKVNDGNRRHGLIEPTAYSSSEKLPCRFIERQNDVSCFNL